MYYLVFKKMNTAKKDIVLDEERCKVLLGSDLFNTINGRSLSPTASPFYPKDVSEEDFRNLIGRELYGEIKGEQITLLSPEAPAFCPSAFRKPAAYQQRLVAFRQPPVAFQYRPVILQQRPAAYYPQFL